MKKPFVSIVMRSMNDIGFIGRTLDGVMSQDFKDFELLNVDSGSTDGTFEIIMKHNPLKTKRIREEYIPGKILNAMAREAAGEIVVFNNSDCIPMNSKWLGDLVAPFLDDPGLGATFANQLPRPDAMPLVAKDNTRAFGDGRISAGWDHFFSLASSATRKTLLLEHPFDEEIKYSEDIEWSLRIKRLGLKILYVSSAQVEHSHNYTDAELRKRFYNEGLADGRIYGSSPSFTKGFLPQYVLETARDILYLLGNGRISAIPSGLKYRFIQRYSAHKGRVDYFRR
jgi:rhamnosyltransferase